MPADLLVIAPLLIPLCTAAVTAILWRHPGLQVALSLLGAASLLLINLKLLAIALQGDIPSGHMGSWPAPFGIVLAIDLLAAVMLTITGIMALAVAIYALGPGRRERDRAGFHPLFHGLLLGVCGSFATADIFNLYVWFEVMLIASFGLMVLDRSREQFDGGIRYVLLNLVGTTLLLVAVGLLYGATGTLNMADLALRVPASENPGLMAAIGMLLLVSFGAKAAVFPLFNWLPASYHTASMPVVAIFSALLTKVGVYAIIRIYTLVFAHDTAFFGPLFWFLAMATMLVGVFGAAAHYDVRKILSFHIVSQIGYMLIGVALMTPLALAGSILYVIHHIIVKGNLFLLAGAMRQHGGSYALARLGGLWQRAPLLGLLFLVPALSLAGVPPLSGFWGKLTVIQASLEVQDYLLAGVALLVGLLTLFSMIKIWNEAFWKAPPVAPPVAAWSTAQRVATYIPIAALALLTLTIGLHTEPFIAASLTAAGQLLDRQAYIAAVLGPDFATHTTGATP